MRLLGTTIIATTLAAGLAAGQGFDGGILGKLNPFSNPDFAYLTRKLPPIVVDLPGSTIKLEAFVAASVPREVADIMITRTKAEILKDRERKIRFDDQNPDVQIRCTITSWEIVEQNRTEVFGNNSRQIKRIIGNASATVEVINSKTRIPLDSENLKHHFEDEYDMATGANTKWWKRVNVKKEGMRIPTPLEQRALLMDGLASKIAQRVVPIEEEVAIAIPKGKKFQEIKKLAEGKRWGQILELAEKMEPFPKPDEDAYREYIIGVGHEAIAYTQSSNPNEIMDALTRAQASYGKAKDVNRGEKKFLDPDIRVQESVDHVIKIIDIQKNGVKLAETPKAPETPSEFNNSYIVHLFKNLRRSEKFILNQIETVSNPKFDDSPAGQDLLFNNGLSEDVVMAVSKRMKAERDRRSGVVNRVAPQAVAPTAPPAAAPTQAIQPQTPPARPAPRPRTAPVVKK